MPPRSTGGNWEDLGRGWSGDSNVTKPTGKIRARYYEDDGKIILGPNGKTIARVVDRSIRMGFRKEED